MSFLDEHERLKVFGFTDPVSDLVCYMTDVVVEYRLGEQCDIHMHSFPVYMWSRNRKLDIENRVWTPLSPRLSSSVRAFPKHCIEHSLDRLERCIQTFVVCMLSAAAVHHAPLLVLFSALVENPPDLILKNRFLATTQEWLIVVTYTTTYSRIRLLSAALHRQ